MVPRKCKNTFLYYLPVLVGEVSSFSCRTQEKEEDIVVRERTGVCVGFFLYFRDGLFKIELCTVLANSLIRRNEKKKNTVILLVGGLRAQ